MLLAPSPTEPDPSSPGPVSPSPVSPSPTSPAATTPAAPAQCTAYVYAGSKVSLCTDFPGSTERACAPEGPVKFQVRVVSPEVDPWALDADEDGIGCDALPVKASSTQTASASPDPDAASLPLTGSGASFVALVGALVLALGVALVVGLRRRTRRFEA